MTHAATEVSVHGQEPVELYEFITPGKTYAYCTCEDPVTWKGIVFAPAYLSRSGVESNSASSKASLDVDISDTQDVVELWRTSALSAMVTLKIHRWHRSQSDTEYATLWNGRVVNARWNADRSVTLTSQSPFTSVRRVGMKRKFQINCPHALYGDLCTLDRGLFEQTYTVTSVIGNVVNIGAIASGGFDADHFAGGYLRWSNPSLIAPTTERGFIVSQSGNDLTLVSPPFALAGGTIVKAYPGCNRTMAICESRFNNLDNYGGFPWRPDNNPFGGLGALIT